MEQWKEIPGFEGRYEVSSKGNVRSVPRLGVDRNGKTRRLSGLTLSLYPNPAGYLCVRLGRGSPAMAHQLVACAFVGPRPEGSYICHNNGDKQDNRRGNLRYDTPKNNQLDRKLHGTYRCGEQIRWAKLTTENVIEIRRLASVGETHSSIAERYGVTRCNVTAIVSRRNWKHV